MNTKDKAIQDILIDFSGLSTIIFQQLKHVDSLLSNNILEEDKMHFFNIIEENEEKIDTYEKEMNEKIINTIVLYHPLAGELRKLISYIRMVSNLERIADLSLNIAYFIDKIDNPNIFKSFYPSLREMLESTNDMIQKALTSFTCKDIELAHKTIDADSKVDKMHDNLINSLLDEKIIEKNKEISTVNSLICINNISSNLERIADNATNIAEAAIYMLDGEDVRHKNN
ncbi:MAG: PhoU domain-containing protein [Marinifilaceae bacterium]|jgi:phosphate transport system protein